MRPAKLSDPHFAMLVTISGVPGSERTVVACQQQLAALLTEIEALGLTVDTELSSISPLHPRLKLGEIPFTAQVSRFVEKYKSMTLEDVWNDAMELEWLKAKLLTLPLDPEEREELMEEYQTAREFFHTVYRAPGGRRILEAINAALISAGYDAYDYKPF